MNKNHPEKFQDDRIKTLTYYLHGDIMKDDLHLELLEVFVKHRVVPDIVLRNERIRLEYKKLKEDGMKPKEARVSLAGKYYISEKSLETILYFKKENADLQSR